MVRLFNSHKDSYGCIACSSIWPCKAIRMESDRSFIHDGVSVA